MYGFDIKDYDLTEFIVDNVRLKQNEFETVAETERASDDLRIQAEQAAKSRAEQGIQSSETLTVQQIRIRNAAKNAVAYADSVWGDVAARKPFCLAIVYATLQTDGRILNHSSPKRYTIRMLCFRIFPHPTLSATIIWSIKAVSVSRAIFSSERNSLSKGIVLLVSSAKRSASSKSFDKSFESVLV